MIRRIAHTVLFAVGSSTTLAQPVQSPIAPPEHGALVVDAHTRIASGRHVRPDRTGQGVLVLDGLSNFELDLDGVELLASSQPTSDRARGVGIVVRNCTDVQLHGGRVRGYAVGLWAENSTGIVIDGLDVSVTYMEPLHSTVTTESDADRLSRELDPSGAWPRSLGAAVRLDDCADWTVRNVRARSGQNGLLVTRGARGSAYDNDFSFLSGWGVALTEVQQVKVTRNRVDFCVRGYSAGHYATGQGSAAFVLEGDCRDVVLAENSAVRAGTGAILSGVGLEGLRAHLLEDALLSVGLDIEDAATQDPDRADDDQGHLEVRFAAPELAVEEPRAPAPQAGDARVWIFSNDFTGAVRGGIVLIDQADVWIVANKLEDCGGAGVRAQRVSGAVIGDNTVQGANGSALALEDVNDCLIARNVLHKSEVGLQIWSSVGEARTPLEGGASYSSCSSDLWITDNSFAENDVDLGVRSTSGLRFGDNIWDAQGGTVATLDISAAAGVPASVLANRDPKTGEERPDQLRLDEWLAGVGDWMPSGHVTSSSVWHPGANEHPAYATFLSFEGLDVPGSPRPRRSLQAADGEPIVLGPFGPWDFEAETERPLLRLPGGVLVGVEWQARWFRWNDETDPRGAPDRWRALAEQPLLLETVQGWPSPWGPDRSVRQTVGDESFGLIAEARMNLPAGRYRLTVGSDDGVLMRIDGEVVLENWSWHPMTRDEVELELAAGEHAFELEYFQIAGPAALTVDLQPID